MASSVEPSSHYREIIVDRGKTPLYRIKSLPEINVYPYQPDIIFGDSDIQPHEGRHPAATIKTFSGSTRKEQSVKSVGNESLDVNVVSSEGRLLTFEVIKRGPAIRQPEFTIDYFMRMRPVAATVVDSDDNVVDEEGWNEQGLLHLYTSSGMQVFVPSIEYGFRFQEGGNVDRVMVRYPLQQVVGGGILVNNNFEIKKVNSKTIEGYYVFPQNSYSWINRGESIECGDVGMSYGPKIDVISLICEDMYSPRYINIFPPVSEKDKWQEFSQSLATNQQERPEAIDRLLNEWNTRMEF